MAFFQAPGKRKRQHPPQSASPKPCPPRVITWNDKPRFASLSGSFLRVSLMLELFPGHAMTTESDGLRQSDRVSLRIPVEASWATSTGTVVKHTAETLLVSRNGGVVRLNEKLSTGQELHLRRHQDGAPCQRPRARVVAEIDPDPPHHFIYAIHILDPRSDFWGIEFPSLRKGEEALARLLMECSFCQRREVVYLDELQLKSFEVRKCVARICKHCDSPSIWIESQSEIRSPEDGAPGTTVEERVIPRRNRTRIKARVLACI